MTVCSIKRSQLFIDSYDDAGYNYFCTYGVTRDDLVNNACDMISDFEDLNYQYLYVIDQNSNVYELENEDGDISERDFLINALEEIEARYKGQWEQFVALRKQFEERSLPFLGESTK